MTRHGVAESLDLPHDIHGNRHAKLFDRGMETLDLGDQPADDNERRIGTDVRTRKGRTAIQFGIRPGVPPARSPGIQSIQIVEQTPKPHPDLAEQIDLGHGTLRIPAPNLFQRDQRHCPEKAHLALDP